MGDGWERGRRRVSVRTNHCAAVRRHWVRWASLCSDALREAAGAALSAPRPVAPEPGRGGETEACAATRGASGSGATCLRVLVQEARAAGSLGGCRVLPRNTAGAVVGPSTSWMSSCFSFPSSSLCPLPAREALLPPTPAGLPATSANPSDFTDIPVELPDTYLSFSCCSLSHTASGREAVLRFCCSDSGRGPWSQEGRWKWCP